MWTLQQAQDQLSTVVDEASAGRPQEVTRNGKPAVVVVATSEYRRLLKEVQQGRESKGSFVDHLMAFPGDEIERAKAKPRPVKF